MQPGELSRIATSEAMGDLPPAARHVLLSLACATNKHAAAYIGIGRLASRTGYSERTVRNSLALLEQDGLIEKTIRPGRSSAFLVLATIPSSGLGLSGSDASTLRLSATPRGGAQDRGGAPGRQGGTSAQARHSKNYSRTKHKTRKPVSQSVSQSEPVTEPLSREEWTRSWESLKAGQSA